jgi:hypothetical protein
MAGLFALIALDPKCGGFDYEFEFNKVPLRCANDR